MEPKVSMVIMSNLSDIQELLQNKHNGEIDFNKAINFVKWLVLKFKDTYVEIDPELEFERFERETKRAAAKKREIEIENNSDEEIMSKIEKETPVMKTKLLETLLVLEVNETYKSADVRKYLNGLFETSSSEDVRLKSIELILKS